MNGTVGSVPVVDVGAFDVGAGNFYSYNRHVLDAGDMYAPQMMVDSTGRRILIGWMGRYEGIVTRD